MIEQKYVSIYEKKQRNTSDWNNEGKGKNEISELLSTLCGEETAFFRLSKFQFFQKNISSFSDKSNKK